MHIIINQPDLVHATNIAQKAVSASNMQILSGILLVARDNMLVLMATDFDISIETKAPCTIKEEGSFVIASNIFGDIVRKLPNRPVLIKKEGDNVKISSGDIFFNLTSLQASEFPSMPQMEDGQVIQMDESSLAKAIDYTIFSTSIDETRPNLQGVLIESGNNQVNFASSDGYRLSRFRLKAQVPEIKAIVPSKSLAELRKILSEDSQLTITSNQSHILFEFAYTKFYSRLLEGKFIEYNKLLDAQLPHQLIVNRSAMVDALERISLLASADKAKLVKISLSNGIMEFESNSEIGRGYEKIDCQYEGDDLKIAFNNKYILEGIKAMRTDKIKINVESSISPAIIEPVDGEDDYNHLVLPVKLMSDD